MSMTLYARVQTLTQLLGGTVYVGLHTANPGDTGSANEVSVSGYARQAASFSLNSSTGTSVNSGALSFPAASSGYTVTHYSIWTAATGGNCLVRQELNAPQTIASGGTATVSAGALTVGGPA
ncbi:hypothetical protein [uncultured Pseudomonas sp.]|uniref:phage tail fiber protein n=1 Tax=uncultured Pseudomonas sp. TaxID=114707 RepID=UPI0025CEEA21|nr:hypothetical protein [uncultured Pseudomonas sp.]